MPNFLHRARGVVIGAPVSFTHRDLIQPTTPNHQVQRTGASRHAEWRCGRRRRLAPVADLVVRPPKPRQTASMNHPSHASAGGGPQSGVPQALLCRKERKKTKEVIHLGRRCVGRSRVGCRLFRPLSFLSATSSHWDGEPGGPANGRQPARRVAMRRSLVAGSRR